MDVITPSTTPLDAARNDLARRTAAADRAGDWKERQILDQLESIADYTCRIGDNRHSTHYRADKAGPLVDAAIRLRRVALENHGGNTDELAKQLYEISKMEIELDHTVSRVMWALTTGYELYQSDLDELRHRISALAAWAGTLTAVPDPADG